MISKIKIDIEADSVDSLCSKLHSELQRYNALGQFIKHIIRYMDEGSLKEIEREIRGRRREHERWLSSWDEDSVGKYLRKLSRDAVEILKLIKQHGRITKSMLMEKTGFKEMKIAGVIAGMNNMAKKMGRRPAILRENIRSGDEWDVEYRIEDSFLELLKKTLT